MGLDRMIRHEYGAGGGVGIGSRIWVVKSFSLTIACIVSSLGAAFWLAALRVFQAMCVHFSG